MKASPPPFAAGFRGGSVEKLIGFDAEIDASERGADSSRPIQALACVSTESFCHEVSFGLKLTEALARASGLSRFDASRLRHGVV